MSGVRGVVVVAGRQWWTTASAVAQLDVSRARLADWVRRSTQAGHTTPAETCQRCATVGDGFPHVDAPVRRGRLYGYLAEQLVEAEYYTASSRRGGVLRCGVDIVAPASHR